MKKHILQATIAALLVAQFSCHHENIIPSNGSSQASNANAAIYSGQLNGIYEHGVALDSNNYILLNLNVQAAGSYEITTSLRHYNKIGIQVVSNLSNKIIIASGGNEFTNVWNTMAITGRGKLLWKIP